MGLKYSTQKGTGSIPVWQGGPTSLELVQGGFALDRTGLPDGFVLQAGTPMVFNEATRTAKPVITGVVFANAGATATDYQVKKGHGFIVGQNFATKTGNKAFPITAINTSNADYDVITVGTTIGAVTAGDFVFASSTTGASNSSFGGVNGLLYADRKVDDMETVSIVRRGAIYARRVPYSADLAAALPLIFYSQSF
jgi:hypothetical protein